MAANAKLREKQLREQGFADGWAGRPARSMLLEYSRAWTRGAAERRKDEAEGAA